MEKSNRRQPRSFLINPRFQLIFIGVMIALAFLVIASTFVANSFFFWKFTQKGQILQLPAGHIFFTFLKEQEKLMNLVFLIESAVIFLMLSIFGLMFSHRIAGPLYKFRNHLESTSKSRRYSQVTFRKKDFFPELAEAYNRQIPKTQITATKKKKTA